MSGSPLHAEIQHAAARWLRKQHDGPNRWPGCPVVLVDPISYAAEQPDVIGWSSTNSVVIEVKVSRSDFFADAKKSHRVWTDGIGNVRFFAVPLGLFLRSEVSDGWGLLEYGPTKCGGRKVITVTRDCPRRTLSQESLFQERILLVSALRKAVK